MAWLSDDIMLIAPRSCRMSSAAMVSRRIRLSAKATSSGMRGSRMVADHQHVEMLVERVDREGPRRIGRGRQHVRQAADLDDVRRMAAARTLGVIGVDDAVLEGWRWSLDESRIRSSVSVWIATWHVHLVRHGQAAIDRRRAWCPSPRAASGRRRPPSPLRAGPAAATHCPCRARPDIARHAFGGLQHPRDMPGPGAQVVALVPSAGPVPPPIRVVTPE
jgi:hypothetical protein